MKKIQNHFSFFFQFFSGFDSLRKSPPRAVQSFAWFSWGSIHFVFKNRWLKPLLHTQRNSRGIEEIISQLSLLLNSSQKKKGDRNKSLRVFDPVWSTTVCQMDTSPISPYSHVQKNWWRPFIRVSAKISRGKKLIGALEVSYTASSSFRFLLNKRRISLKCVYFEELINGMHAVAKTLLNEKLLLIQHLWLSGFWIPASSSNM